MEEEKYEEVMLSCEVCGKEVKMVKRKGYGSDTFLCQRCGKQGIGAE